MKFIIKDTLKMVLILSCVSATQIKPANAQALENLGRPQANHVDQASQIDDCFLKCTLCSQSILKDGENNEKFTTTPCQHFFHKGCLDRHKQAQSKRQESESCPSCEQKIVPSKNPADPEKTTKELQEEAKTDLLTIEEIIRQVRRENSLRRLTMSLKYSLITAAILTATKANPELCTRLNRSCIIYLVLLCGAESATPSYFAASLPELDIQPKLVALTIGSWIALKINK